MCDLTEKMVKNTREIEIDKMLYYYIHGVHEAASRG